MTFSVTRLGRDRDSSVSGQEPEHTLYETPLVPIVLPSLTKSGRTTEMWLTGHALPDYLNLAKLRFDERSGTVMFTVQIKEARGGTSELNWRNIVADTAGIGLSLAIASAAAMYAVLKLSLSTAATVLLTVSTPAVLFGVACFKDLVRGARAGE